jgi:cupin 2 domain-containing protein
MAHADGNLFTRIDVAGAAETVTELLARPGIRIERIVSPGQSSPHGCWYHQSTDEWVIVVAGAARVDFDGDAPCNLLPGDYLMIPAQKRHRVAWTHPALPTIWLALHMPPAEADPSRARGRS